MMNNGRYSRFIRPILYIIDLLIISLLSYFLVTDDLVDILFFVLFWVVLSLFFSIYQVYRFTKIIKVISLLSKQLVVLILLIFAYFYIIELAIPSSIVFYYFIILFLVFNAWRMTLHLIFKKYRIITGSNYKKVVIIGCNESTEKLKYFFRNTPEYGYRLVDSFDNKNARITESLISQCYNFVIENEVDEIYCSIKELNDRQIKEFIEFCDVNLKTLKFIPDNKEIYSKNLHLNYYDLIPVLSMREIPLDDPIKSWIKRIFDIIFSLVIIFFVLSWLIPVLTILIKIESKGPVFFQQNRPGMKEKGFRCYKFRSMGVNVGPEDSAVRNDPRVTKVGRFIRRTSIDELPQFFNVLFGDMSVVGPRPHLWKQNEMYGTKVSKYMVRHFVKPGITGLAQVKGYRGEIESKKDIVNRTKYDIFYIENWSLLLDMNIILQTIFNVIKGEEKAY